jgi:hypothetical protein
MIETFNFLFMSKIKFPFQKVIFTRPNRTWVLLDLKLKHKYIYILVGILINLKRMLFAN